MLVQDAVQDAKVMSINCAEDLDLCLEMDVRAYPAIRLYSGNGRVSRYRGPRKFTP